MKIILCTNVYPPHFIGGAELIAHYQAKTLQGFGHQVVIFTGDVRPIGKRHSLRQENYDGLAVYRVHLQAQDYQPEYTNFHHPEVERHFEELLDKLKPDVVHFHNIIGLSVKIISLAKQQGAKTVLTLHDNWGVCYKNTLMKREGEICQDYTRCAECMPFIHDGGNKYIPMRLRRDFISMQMRYIDAFISPSSYLAGNYIRAGFPADNIHIIWNGIDVNRFECVKKKNSEFIRLSFIGHFGRHKGVHTLLTACSLVATDYRYRLKINLVGDGEEKSHYEKLIGELGLGDVVKFWGKLDNSEIEKVYAETDVLVLPSIWPENQPVSITEAMASKIPVIVSNLGGGTELIEDGHSGYSFQAGNSSDLSEKIGMFLDNPDRIKFFGENAYKVISEVTFERQTRKILDIYNSQESQYSNMGNEDAIIACSGGSFEKQDADMLNQLPSGNGYCFSMSNWLEEDQIRKARLYWVTDREATKESMMPALERKLPLLVPESNAKLSAYCKENNCGLYYASAEEAAACLDYLVNERAISKLLGENGYNSLG